MNLECFFKKIGLYKPAMTSVAFACALLLPIQGMAQIAATPCDPTYFQSMEQRAWLEAEREIIQNQNLIFKPDSVLSYTCFDRYLFELADHATNMFSETDRWGTDVLGSSADQDDHMNRALEILVSASLNIYLNSNFHGNGILNLLGGRSPTSRPVVDPNIPDGSSYSCDVMQTVWMEAKCYDFIVEPGDGFFTFENYASNSNKRQFPEACAAAGAGALNAMFQTAIDDSGLNPATPPPWPLDSTLTYLDNFDAASCGVAAFVPIPTGVIVRRTQQTPLEYFEGVCIQPGCHYVPAGGIGGVPTAGGTCVP